MSQVMNVVLKQITSVVFVTWFLKEGIIVCLKIIHLLINKYISIISTHEVKIRG